MTSFKKILRKNSEIKKNPEKKILKRKSRDNFIRERGFTTKEKISSNLPTSLLNQKNYTCVLLHSTNSFGKKPYRPLIDLQIQGNKFVIVLQVVVEIKESEGKYSFIKNIIFEIVPHNILISINILLTLFFLLFC